MKKNLKELEKKIGYKFQNASLLEQAGRGSGQGP